MKHYIIQRQESPEATPQRVAVKGKPRTFAASKIAVKLALFVKREMGGIVKVVSRGHEGPPEVVEV